MALPQPTTNIVANWNVAVTWRPDTSFTAVTRYFNQRAVSSADALAKTKLQMAMHESGVGTFIGFAATYGTPSTGWVDPVTGTP